MNCSVLFLAQAWLHDTPEGDIPASFFGGEIPRRGRVCCTRIAMLRLIETGWACGGVLALKMVLLARNRYTELSNLVIENYQG